MATQPSLTRFKSVLLGIVLATFAAAGHAFPSFGSGNGSGGSGSPSFGLKLNKAFDPLPVMRFSFDQGVVVQALDAAGDPVTDPYDVAKLRIVGTAIGGAFNAAGQFTDAARWAVDFTYTAGVYFDDDFDDPIDPTFYVDEYPYGDGAGTVTYLGGVFSPGDPDPVDLAFTNTDEHDCQTAANPGGSLLCQFALSIDPNAGFPAFEFHVAFEIVDSSLSGTPGVIEIFDCGEVEEEEGYYEEECDVTYVRLLDTGEGQGFFAHNACDPLDVDPDVVGSNVNYAGEPLCFSEYNNPVDPITLAQELRDGPKFDGDAQLAQVDPALAGGGQAGSAVVVAVDVQTNSPSHISVLRLTNNHPTDDVRVHLVLVCGSEVGFGGTGFCEGSNREVLLTHNETRAINLHRFFGIDETRCATGYVMAYAVDPALGPGQPISWNHLTSSLYVRTVGGPGLNWTMGSEGYVLRSPQPQGAPIGTGGAFPTLPFDGIQYQRLSTVSSTDFVATNGPRGSALWVMTVGIQAGASNPPTVLAVDWWNEGEDLFSSSHQYVCQSRIPLGDLSSGFTLGGLGSFYGNLRITPAGTAAVLGFIEELEPNRRTLRPLYGDKQPRNAIFTGR